MKPEFKTLGAYTAVALFPFLLFYFPYFSVQFHISPDSQAAIAHAPWFALMLLGLLGWRLNQTRILFSSLALLGVLHLLRSGGSPTLLGLQGKELWKMLAIALPLGLGLLFSFREAPLFSQRSLLRLLLACMPAFLLSGLWGGDAAAFTATVNWQAYPDGVMQLPQAALFLWIGFLVMALTHPDTKIRPYLQALAFSLLPLFMAFECAMVPLAAPQWHPDWPQTLIVAAAVSSSGLLLWAILAMYWHRVYLDELTGIPNRRALDEKLASLDDNYALAMVDIDHFKKFNDSYGHEEGDNVLRLVARHLKDGSGGRAYRYGGEEFCMVFEGWGSQKAEEHADSIRSALAARDFQIRMPDKIRKKTSSEDRGSLHTKSLSVKVTISIGVSMPDKKHVYAHEVIKLADEGLYDAKEKGRNCVVRKN